VGQIWLISLGIADGLLVLFLLAAGALLMTNETLHSRYALKDAIPADRGRRSRCQRRCRSPVG
jgi:hypothetical protein